MDDSNHCTLCKWRSVTENLRQNKCRYCGHSHPLVTSYTPEHFVKVKYSCVMCSAVWNISFPWEVTEGLPRIDPSGIDINEADARKYWEDRLEELKKDPDKNAEEIEGIYTMLRLA